MINTNKNYLKLLSIFENIRYIRQFHNENKKLYI